MRLAARSSTCSARRSRAARSATSYRGDPLRRSTRRARRGSTPIVDERVGEGMVELVERHALAADVLDAADVEQIRRDMLEAEARRLQPHYVRSWFAAALPSWAAGWLSARRGRFEITHVPAAVRERDRTLPHGYQCFPL